MAVVGVSVGATCLTGCLSMIYNLTKRKSPKGVQLDNNRRIVGMDCGAWEKAFVNHARLYVTEVCCSDCLRYMR